jgi:2-polyprenyl-3-methyl-5-hydroxy-6-metoxy-1,4-benzoquinol methylase
MRETARSEVDGSPASSSTSGPRADRAGPRNPQAPDRGRVARIAPPSTYELPSGRVRVPGPDSAILAEQRRFYAERAPEYDQWWDRRGRYDRGPEFKREWDVERGAAEEAFDACPLGGRVLELAAGTGIWTQRLAARGATVTAVDASPETLVINRARLGPLADRVEYVVADLFDWSPPGAFDAAVLCFWISHVPRDRLDRFLGMVAAALRPEGSIFILDTLREPDAGAKNHQLPAEGEEIAVRELNDGRTFRVVKTFLAPAEVERHCTTAGLSVNVGRTGRFLWYAAGQKVRGPGCR